MSGNMRNQPTEGQGKSGRAAGNTEQKRYEGFEGMNYEQRRQPYGPQYVSIKVRREIINGKAGERQNEF